MKHLITIICLLLCSVTAQASWFSKGPDPLDEAKEKIILLENHLSAQALLLNRWQIASGSLGIACVILLIIGTALGSKTRNQYKHETSRRMGSTSPSNLNGRKSSNLGKTPEDASHSTLAA